MASKINACINYDVKWAWGKQAQLRFENSKQLSTDKKVLTPYDPMLPITLTGDSSPYDQKTVLNNL